MIVRVRGRRIPVRRRRLGRRWWGLTYLSDPEPEIQVSRRLRSPRSILTTVLHETLHHQYPRLPEKKILLLERQLTTLMRENKTLFRRLLRSL